MFLSFLDEEKYLNLRCGEGVRLVLHEMIRTYGTILQYDDRNPIL